MQFDDWLNNEKYEMEVSIGGLENMANFNYQGGDTKDLLMATVEVALRDIAVRQYR
jgi:hypothetical protein